MKISIPYECFKLTWLVKINGLPVHPIVWKEQWWSKTLQYINIYLVQWIIIDWYKRYCRILFADITYRSGDNLLGVYKEDKTLCKYCWQGSWHGLGDSIHDHPWPGTLQYCGQVWGSLVCTYILLYLRPGFLTFSTVANESYTVKCRKYYTGLLDKVYITVDVLIIKY